MAERKVIHISSQPPKALPRPQPQAPEGPMPTPVFRPGVGTLPFKPGSIFLTQDEQVKLRKLGWKPGDPIPPNLAQALKAEMKAVQSDIDESLPVDPSTPPVKVPPAVDIDSLPPERQQALRDFMAQYKVNQEAVAAGDDTAMLDFLPADPSIRQAMAQVQQAGQVQVTDSRTKDRGTIIGGPPKEAPPAPPAAAAAPAKAETPAGLAGGSPPALKCPHCDRRLADPVDLVPDETDKMTYVQSIGFGMRFKKAFAFFGGKVHVTFKSLAINEAELCVTQLAYDQRDGKIVSYDQAAMVLLDYRLALMVDSIKVGDEFLELPEDLADWQVDGDQVASNPPQTKLPKILEYMQTRTPLKREALWRIVGQESQRFHRLSEYLEKRAPDPDFWKPIGDAT